MIPFDSKVDTDNNILNISVKTIIKILNDI